MRRITLLLCAGVLACSRNEAPTFVPTSSGFAVRDAAYSADLSPTRIAIGRGELRPRGSVSPSSAAAAESALRFALGATGLRRGTEVVRVADAAPTRVASDGAVEFERGPFIERWRRQAGTLEQSWRFEKPPAGAGALEVRAPVLLGKFEGEDADGLLFSTPLGDSVRYGHGTWIDADGRRTAIPSRWNGEAITLTVPAETLAGSRWPAVLDPTITVLGGMPRGGEGDGAVEDFAVATSSTAALVVWRACPTSETCFLLSRLISSNGTPLGRANVIDASPFNGIADVASDGTSFFAVFLSGDRNSNAFYVVPISGSTGAPTGERRLVGNLISRLGGRPGGPYLLCGSGRCVRLDAGGREIGTPVSVGDTPVAVGFLDDAWHVLGSTSYPQTIRLRTLTADAGLVSGPLEVCASPLSSASIATDGSRALIACHSGQIRFWDPALATLSAPIELGGAVNPTSVSFDGSTYVLVRTLWSPTGLSTYRVPPDATAAPPLADTLPLSVYSEGKVRVISVGASSLVFLNPRETSESTADLVVYPLDPDGQLGTPTSVSARPLSSGQMAVASGPTQRLVAWVEADESTSNRRVLAVRTNLDGTPLDTTPLVLGQGMTLRDLAAAASPTDALVMWAGGLYTEVYAVRVGNDGTFTGPREIPGNSTYGRTEVFSPHGLVFDGTQYVFARYTRSGNWSVGNSSNGGVFAIAPGTDVPQQIDWRKSHYDAPPSVVATVDGTAWLVAHLQDNGGHKAVPIRNGTLALPGVALTDPWSYPVSARATDWEGRLAVVRNYLGMTGQDRLDVLDVAGTRIERSAWLRAGEEVLELTSDGPDLFVLARIKSSDTRILRRFRWLDGALVDFEPASGFALPHAPTEVRFVPGTEPLQLLQRIVVPPSPFRPVFTRLGGYRPPRFAATTFSGAEDEPLPVDLSVADLDGTDVTLTFLSQPSFGTLTGEPPSLVFQPNAHWNGTTTFRVRAADGDGDVVTQPITLTLAPVPDAPLATDQTLLATSGQPRAIRLAGVDYDRLSLSFLVRSTPANGTLTGTSPNLTYTSNAGFVGTDAFTFRATNGTMFDDGTVTLTVEPPNNAPVASDVAVTLAEDTSATVVLAATDADGHPLTWTLGAPSCTGATVMGAPPNVTFTPPPDFHGTCTFTFRVNDGRADSNQATATITVTPAPDLPVAHPQTLAVDEDGSRSVALTGRDPDGSLLTGFRIVTPPAHGSLTGTAPSLTYRPAANYAGTDHFTFVVTSGGQESEPATVSFTIAPVNDAPVATSVSVVGPRDRNVPVVLTATDPDGDALTWTVTAPTQGTLTGVAPNLTFRAPAGQSGTFTFSFRVSDGTLTSSSANVTISVLANTPPTALDGTMTVAEDGASTVTLGGTDPEGASLRFRVVEEPAAGTVTIAGIQATYRPPADFHGDVRWRYVANDGVFDSEPATMEVTVTPVNDAPVAQPITATATEDQPFTVTLAATDAEGDAVSFLVDPSVANVTIEGDVATVVPPPDVSGTWSFEYRATDGALTSTPATVSVTLAPLPDAPLLRTTSFTVREDEETLLEVAPFDPDGEPVTLAIVTPPGHGTAAVSGAGVTYLPEADYAGSDALIVSVTDGNTVETFPIEVTVEPVNDAPRPETGAFATDEDLAVPVTLVATDPDSTVLTWQIASPPQHGQLTGIAPELTYVPTADWSGEDRFTFVVRDGEASSPATEVRVTVRPLNDAPRAVSRERVVSQGTTSIALTGVDPDGDTLRFAVVAPPEVGTLQGTPPNLAWTSPPGFRGRTSFTFTVSDAEATSEPGTVTLDVSNAPPAVRLVAPALQVAEGGTLTFEADASDPGEDTLTYAWDFGDGERASGSSVSHVFRADGTHEVSVRVSDGVDEVSASVSVAVTNVRPTIADVVFPDAIDEGGTARFEVTATDPVDALEITWTFGDGSPDSSGPFVDHRFADDGSFSVVVRVSDGTDAITQTRQVTVRNVAPTVDPSQLSHAFVPGEPFELRLIAIDPAKAPDPVTFAKLSGPGTLGEDGSYSWLPDADERDEVTVSMMASDDEGGSTRFELVLSPKPGSGSGCGCASGAEAWPALAALGALLRGRLRRDRARRG